LRNVSADKGGRKNEELSGHSCSFSFRFEDGYC